MSPLDEIPNDKFYIFYDSTRFFQPTWSHSLEICPVTYEIYRIVDGIERPLNQEEMNVVKFNQIDQSLEYETSNFALDGQTWNISIKMLSTLSSQPDDNQYVFDIEWIDSCWDRVINPITFDNLELTYDLWQSEFLSFSHDSNPLPTETDLCEGFTYELVYKSGPALDLTLP